jgi:hypothetical protein
VALSIACAIACDKAPTAPSSSAVVTFAVAGETFRVALTTAEQVAAAHAAQNGGREKIPTGRIVPGMQVNTAWSWHLEDVAFAEVTIELCDGRPSDVGRAGVQFGGGASARGAQPVRIDSRAHSGRQNRVTDTKV